MFEKNATARHKNEHRVIVTLTGQEPFEAFVFLKINERLIDLLNDQRMFIPIKRADGATLIASKQNIVSIIEKPDEEAPLASEPAIAQPEATAAASDEPAENAGPAPDDDKAGAAKEEPNREAPSAEEFARRIKKSRRQFDPYDILRVARDAGPEEIRKAYHARMKQVHPDAIAALDLDEDLARAANISAQRVNRAYRVLMRGKQETPKPEESAA